MPVKLYTTGTLAEFLGVAHSKFSHWANKEKVGFVEPYALIAKHNKGDEVFLKVWHEDQLDEVKEGWAKYQQHLTAEAVAAKTRRKRYNQEYNYKYYLENKERLRLQQAKQRIVERARQEESDAEFIERDQREREARAIQFLIEKDLV